MPSGVNRAAMDLSIEDILAKWTSSAISYSTLEGPTYGTSWSC
eukprot:gene29529-38639_t